MSWLLALISSLFGLGDLALGGAQAASNENAQREANATNLQMNRETNETNVQLQEMANAANVQQAELAYQRSLPINQVRDLMNAGVSKSAALQKLTGGGLYSAPVLSAAQSQAGHVNPVMQDFSKMSEAFQQLGNIPANVQQAQISEQNYKNLRQEYDLRAADEKRKQELHEFELWSRQYGKDNATALDNATNLVLTKLLDSGKEITDFKSYDDLIRGLGLSSEPIIRHLPSAARAQVESAVRDRFSEARAQRQQENSDVAASDAHNRAIDDLRNSALGRKLTAAQINNIKSNTLKLNAEVIDMNDEHDAKQKEYKLREARATFLKLVEDFNLKVEELRNDFYFDEHGVPKLKTINTLEAKEFWNMVAKTIGLESIGDILRGIFSLAK